MSSPGDSSAGQRFNMGKAPVMIKTTPQKDFMGV